MRLPAGIILQGIEARSTMENRQANMNTDECNATLTGNYLWSNVNFGEAVTEPMTPLAWSVLQFTLDDWIFLRGFPTVGNIGGRPYLNISVLATILHAMRRDRQAMMQSLEGTLYMRLPESIEIPLIPLSGREWLSSLPCLAQIRRNQRRGLRQLSSYLAETPFWFQQMRARLRAASIQPRSWRCGATQSVLTSSKGCGACWVSPPIPPITPSNCAGT
jgi:pyruvate,water dikinase